MTVHARGYRGYEGGYRASPAAFAIAREGFLFAWRSKAFRRLGVIYLIGFVVCAFMLYMTIGAGVKAFDFSSGGSAEAYSRGALVMALRYFFTWVAILTALLAIFVGSGLIADDLAAGALALYLVRPIRAADYVVGKGLVLPGILLFAVLVPGFFFYLLVGFWQPPGETWAFLTGNLDVMERILAHYLLAAASYTGLMLLLSSRTPRRTAVSILAAALIFGGVLLQGMAARGLVQGGLRQILLLADLPKDTVSPLIRLAQPYRTHGHFTALPSETGVAVVAGGLLVLGIVAAWRRARTVEVTG